MCMCGGVFCLFIFFQHHNNYEIHVCVQATDVDFFSLESMTEFLNSKQCLVNVDSVMQSKKISNDQELIQSDPTSCPKNQKENNLNT